VLREEECGGERECERAPARSDECHRVENPFLEDVRELSRPAPSVGAAVRPSR
jgi:hypothetical protein